MMSTEKSEMTTTCGACNVRCQRFGKHRNRLRRFRCPQCKRTYTENHRRTLDTMYISQDRAVLALQLLLEGNSIRSTERITKLERNTIMSLLIRAGERCKRLMDEKMRNLHLEHLQIDEIWTYVQKKARRIRSGDSPELGDQWVFVALDETTPRRPSLQLATTFEMQARRLRLTPDTYLLSDELRAWCERNRNRFYVPEWLLDMWDIPR